MVTCQYMYGWDENALTYSGSAHLGKMSRTKWSGACWESVRMKRFARVSWRKRWDVQQRRQRWGLIRLGLFLTRHRPVLSSSTVSLSHNRGFSLFSAQFHSILTRDFIDPPFMMRWRTLGEQGICCSLKKERRAFVCLHFCHSIIRPLQQKGSMCSHLWDVSLDVAQ